MSTPETSDSGLKQRAYEGIQSAGFRTAEAIVQIVTDEIKHFLLEGINRWNSPSLTLRGMSAAGLSES